MAKTITRDDLRQKQDRHELFSLVDVLPAEEYERSHIQGAMNVPLKEIETMRGRFDPDWEIIVYCGSYQCSASTTAAEQLELLGYTNVAVYGGGKKEWMESGFPMEMLTHA